MIVINNRDFNIDQNNRDYDFGHNRAALTGCRFFLLLNTDSTAWGAQENSSALSRGQNLKGSRARVSNSTTFYRPQESRNSGNFQSCKLSMGSTGINKINLLKLKVRIK